LESIGWADLVPESIGTVWKPSDALRARRTLLKQYGAILKTWAEESSWAGLGPAIADELEAIRLESAIAEGKKGASADYSALLEKAVDTV